MKTNKTRKPDKKAQTTRPLTLKTKDAARVKGGATLMEACATGVHFKKATITS